MYTSDRYVQINWAIVLVGGVRENKKKKMHKNLKRKLCETWLSGLGAIFRGVRKTEKIYCLSVRLHGTTAMPLDGFS